MSAPTLELILASGTTHIPVNLGVTVKELLAEHGVDVESVTARLNGVIVNGEEVPKAGDEIHAIGNVKAGMIPHVYLTQVRRDSWHMPGINLLLPGVKIKPTRLV